LEQSLVTSPLWEYLRLVFDAGIDFTVNDDDDEYDEG
jgi:hypothetical protein